MSTDMRKHVLDLLETYQERERKIALLRYELEHPAHVSSEEMIGTMSLRRSDGIGPSGGHISDKTLYIALNYQDRTDKINSDAKESIVVELVELERTQKQLEYYLSLLDAREAKVLRLTYLDRLSQEKIAKSMDTSVRTVQTLKSKALKSLTKMYQLIETLS